MKQPRIHREWFRPVERGHRKSCPSCKTKLEPGEQIWSWGEYHNGRWHNVHDTCKACWPTVAQKLEDHATLCPENCRIEIVCKGAPRPDWMKLTNEDSGTPQTVKREVR